MSEENKQKLKEFQKNIVKLIKADSLNLIKNMHDYIRDKIFILLIFYLSMNCLSSII